MRLLVTTQKVDKDDDVLGFFHHWLEKIAQRFDFVTVVCLEKGNYNLPDNVKVISLGKEKTRANSLVYAWRFLQIAIKEKKNYDAIFSHMNPEYICVAGVLWKLWHKKIALWYNHKIGSWAAKYAFQLADKIFYTSDFAYAAKSTKSQVMPVGIDIDQFAGEATFSGKNKILSLGRISPVKNIDVLVKACQILDEENFDFTCHIYGDAPERDQAYYEKVKSMAQMLTKKNKIYFYPGISNDQAPDLYRQHDLFVNMTPSGSFDKTIIEAMTARNLVLICNHSLGGFLPDKFLFAEGNAKDMADKIKNIFALENKQEYQNSFFDYAKSEHSLDSLLDKLAEFFYGKK